MDLYRKYAVTIFCMLTGLMIIPRIFNNLTWQSSDQDAATQVCAQVTGCDLIKVSPDRLKDEHGHYKSQWLASVKENVTLSQKQEIALKIEEINSKNINPITDILFQAAAPRIIVN